MPYCLGDPIPEGVRVLSHADLEAEHYTAIRSNPRYRIEWNRLEWEARQEPPITQERAPDEPQSTPRPVEHIKYEVHRTKGKISQKPKSVKKAGSDIAIKRK